MDLSNANRFNPLGSYIYIYTLIFNKEFIFFSGITIVVLVLLVVIGRVVVEFLWHNNGACLV